MSKPAFVSVLMVNYNSGHYAKACIESLFKQRNIQLEIIVVDNASADDSIALLKNAFGNRISIIESNENMGFGRANNLAANSAHGEFLLLLNPDTVIADTLAISKMVDFYGENQRYGMVGPNIHEARKNKYVAPRYTYPSSRQLKFKQKFEALPGKIAWLLGACLLLKRKVYQQISGFDPDYFLYGEDADIGLRIRQHGFEIGFCEQVNIEHVSGASEIGADSLDKWLRKRRGIFLFYTKHYDSRDVMCIAQHAIIKSSLGLKWLSMTKLLRANVVDRQHRLQATKIVAKEVLNQLKLTTK